MHNALVMRGFQCSANVLRNVECFFDSEPSTKDPIGKSLALNELEHKESCLIRFFEIVNGSNVRMVQRRQHFGFTLETTHTIGITRKLVRKNLDCYLALQL